MPGADDALKDCIEGEDVKTEFWEELGDVDPIDSTDPCKKTIEED